MAATVPALGAQFRPKAPQTFEEAGVSQTLVTDLVLKRALLQGFATLGALSGTLKLSPAIIEVVFRQLRQQQLIEIKGMIGNDYQFVLSSAGRTLAADRFQINQYAARARFPWPAITREPRHRPRKWNRTVEAYAGRSTTWC